MIPLTLKYFLAFLFPLFGAFYLIPRLRTIATRINLLDIPKEKRNIHSSPTPLVGGIAIVISVTFSIMLLTGLQGMRGFFLGLALLLLVGFLDDLLDLDSKRKFLAQTGATVLMIYFSKTALLSFGDLLGCGSLTLPQTPWIIYPVTIFCVAGVINAINLVDGLDGLAGGIALISFSAFALLAFFENKPILTLINLAFAGGIAGFLRYNWNPATVFMGDAGSLCLGFALAFMALALTQGETAGVSPAIPLIILALPITDTIVVMTKRMLLKKNPFKADRYHLHHITLRYGLSRVGVVYMFLGASLFAASLAIISYAMKIYDYHIFLVYMLFFISYFSLSFFIKKFYKKLLFWKSKRSFL